MKPYVPNCAHDLFISYAHRDDRNWVAAFEKSLRETVSQRLGSDIVVWKDTRDIEAGQNFEDEIKSAVAQSAVMVALTSPSYLNSEWCRQERLAFGEQFKEIGGLESSRRFCVALKTPWENEGHKFFLPKIKQVRFYRASDDGDEYEFVPGTDDFKTAIRSLAAGVAECLRLQRRKCDRVFLGSPHDDCLHVWKQLGEELRALNYDVQPPSRRDAAFADELLKSEMKDTRLSVHLLGAAYDAFCERQILLAADSAHRLMFWVAPAPGASVDEQQSEIVASIRKGKRPRSDDAISLPDGWTLLDDRDPRRLIDEVLIALRPPKQQPLEPGDHINIYILHDATTAEDNRVATSLRDQMARQEKLTISVSRADLGSPGAVQERHERMMRSCDGMLLYRKAAPDAWLKQLAPEVILAEQLLKRGPLRSKAFLLPDTSGWGSLPNLSVIPYRPTFQLHDLEPFLAPLRERRDSNA